MASPRLPPPPPALWHVAQGGQSVGPFTEAQLVQATAQGRVGRDSQVWTTGMAGWAAASGVVSLAPLFDTPPPPPQDDGA